MSADLNVKSSIEEMPIKDVVLCFGRVPPGGLPDRQCNAEVAGPENHNSYILTIQYR